MKVSIKTIKITSVISALSLVIALLMGAEYFKDASQIYLFGISWVTLQNTAFGIFGSAALAAVSAGIIYGVDKEAYLNKSEQYLIHVCTKSKTAFVQLTEANKILENGILSKNEKATFTGVSTIVSFIETQQEAIQPASMQFLFKRSQVASYNALLCRCHEVTQGLIQLSNKLQVKYGHWEINDAVKNAAQSSTGLDSPLLDEAKSCSEEDLRLTINQISWQLNNVIQYTTLAIHQLFYLQKKEDKLQSTFQLMDDQAQYYQKTLEVQAPTVDEKTIAEHQIKVVQQIASSAIEDLDILDDIEVLRDTLEVPSFARKLSKVKKASPIFKLGISKEAIVEFTKNTPELAGKFKYSEDGTQIRLGTKKSKIAFLKLMNDAFLHSELTKQWYDASAKDNITQGAG